MQNIKKLHAKLHPGTFHIRAFLRSMDFEDISWKVKIGKGTSFIYNNLDIHDVVDEGCVGAS